MTKNQLKHEFGPEKGKLLSDSFENRFNALIELNEGFLKDDLAKRHGINPLFIISLVDPLKNENITFKDLKRHVLSVFKVMLQEILKNQVEELSKSKNLWKAFIDSCKAGNKQLYDNEYFNLIITNDNESKFEFDINRCLYYEIFERNGYSHLGPILCEYDYILSSNVEKWIKFERKETIAKGKPRCDFRYYPKSK